MTGTLLYGLIRCAAALVRVLPLRLAYAAACLTADVTFLLWRRGRRDMIANMAQVLGSRPGVPWRARHALRNYLKYLVDFLRAPGMTQEEIASRMTFNQWEPFDEAMAGGKGAIFVGLHMGNWDIGGAVLALKGYPMTVVVDTFRNRRLNDFVQGTRARLGMKTIPREDAARRVLQALRRNEALAILMDRPARGDAGVEIQFFGRKTMVPAGAATLALRTGARIVPAGMVRLPDDRFLGLVDRCIDYEPTGDRDRDVRELTQLIMDSLARWVREYPDQWYKFQRMWPA